MSRLPPLHAIAYFEAVARLGTVAAAARELSVSPSAVSHQIRTLEESIGVSLFQRVKRRLLLTEPGERLYDSASSALGALRITQEQIQGREHRLQLVGKVAMSFAVAWLLPKLSDFNQAHPDIDLEIHASPNRSDFSAEAVDFDIRYGKGDDWQDLHSEPIITDLALPVAHPSDPVFGASGAVAQRLAGRPLIQTVAARFQWRDWLTQNGVHDLNPQHSLRFSSTELSVQAAEQGMGVAFESTSMLLEPFLRGTLKPVFPNLKGISFHAYWLVCPRRHLQRRPLALFREWLLDQGRTHQAAFEAFLAEHR